MAIDNLDDGPSPNRQIVLLVVCVIAAIYFWNLLPLIIAAAASGWYFGNYQGRVTVMRAWISEKDAKINKLIERVGVE